MRVGIDFRRASCWRDCSRLIRRAFPRYATCIPTMHVGWKPLRADARARFLALSPCQSFLLRPTSAWFIFHLLSTVTQVKSPSFYPRSGLRCQLVGFVQVPRSGTCTNSEISNFFARTVVRARHRVVMISLRACTAIRDNMPGGLLDTSFLVGGMGMHACTVEGAITSTQYIYILIVYI
jgi:hypothetical protein